MLKKELEREKRMRLEKRAGFQKRIFELDYSILSRSTRRFLGVESSVSLVVFSGGGDGQASTASLSPPLVTFNATQFQQAFV